MPVWIWFVAAGVLGVAELLTGTFYMLILAVAACFGAAASLLGFGATIQVVVAAVAASLGCGGTSGGVIRPGGLLRSLVTTPSISGSRSR